MSVRGSVAFFILVVLLFFFFSSRRRHTRFKCDWSSDVCSSDLKTNPKRQNHDQQHYRCSCGQFDAFVAEKHGRTGDELAHLVLALAAEQAVERILGIATADFAHLRTRTRYKSSQPLPHRPIQAHPRSRRRTCAHAPARKVSAPRLINYRGSS